MRHAYREMHSDSSQGKDDAKIKKMISFDLKTVKAFCHLVQMVYVRGKDRDAATPT